MLIHLTRDILSAILHGDIEIHGYRPDDVSRHLKMLHDEYIFDDSKVLTRRGHDLAGMLLNKPIWDELTSKFTPHELDALPLSEIEHAAKIVTRKWIEARLG